MSIFPPDLLEGAQGVLALAHARGLRIVTAESCTGGLVAALLTEIAGASDVVDRGYVPYSNAAKAGALGVPEALIARHGAVSEPVARAMAEGALSTAKAQLAVSIPGVAGPGGGAADKPVGLVWFATASDRGATQAVEMRYGDLDRGEVRLQAVRTALERLSERLGAP